jgi:hypothetical protein
MTNNRNDRVKDGKDVKKYLEEMIKNAEKHGITIQTVIFKAYRIGHGGILNPKMLTADVEEIIEDTKAVAEQLVLRSIVGCDDGEN